MADHSIQVEYNQEFKPLEQLLFGRQTGRGIFSSADTVEVPMPKLVGRKERAFFRFQSHRNQIAALMGRLLARPTDGARKPSLMNRSAKCGRYHEQDEVEREVVGGKF